MFPQDTVGGKQKKFTRTPPDSKQIQIIADGNKAADAANFTVSPLIDSAPLGSRTGTKLCPM